MKNLMREADGQRRRKAAAMAAGAMLGVKSSVSAASSSKLVSTSAGKPASSVSTTGVSDTTTATSVTVIPTTAAASTSRAAQPEDGEPMEVTDEDIGVNGSVRSSVVDVGTATGSSTEISSTRVVDGAPESGQAEPMAKVK